MDTKGRHLIADIYNLSYELCEDDKKVLKALVESAEEAGATVLSTGRYRMGFNSPPGFACFVLLDESHCSAHTYAVYGMMAVDIFTCGKTDPKEVFRRFLEKIGVKDTDNIVVRNIERFIVQSSFEEVAYGNKNN